MIVAQAAQKNHVLRLALVTCFMLFGIENAFASTLQWQETCDIHIQSKSDLIINNSCEPGDVVRIVYKNKFEAFNLENHVSMVCDYSKTIFAQNGGGDANKKHIVSCVYAGSEERRESLFELFETEPKDNDESAAWKYKKKGP